MIGEAEFVVGRLSIGDVARRSGHTVVTLRHWESMELLPVAPRVGGRRRYPPSVFSRIALIDAARRAGFRLEEIRDLLSTRIDGAPPGDEWRALVEIKRAELQELAVALTACRAWLDRLADCRCATLTDCVGQEGVAS